MNAHQTIQVTLPRDVIAVIQAQRSKEHMVRGWKPTRGFIIEEAIRATYGKHSRNHIKRKRVAHPNGN